MRPHQTRSLPLLGSDVEWESDSMTLVGETAFSNSTGGPYIKRKCLTSNKKYKRISPAIANFSSCLQAKELMLPSRDPSISISGLLMSPPLRSFSGARTTRLFSSCYESLLNDLSLWNVEANFEASPLSVTAPSFVETLVRLACEYDAAFDGWGTSI